MSNSKARNIECSMLEVSLDVGPWNLALFSGCHNANPCDGAKEAMRITAIKVDEMKSINGGEENIDPTTPRGALAEFYRAYNNHDLALMEQNWFPGPDVTMNNPLGGIRRGWPEIRQLYEKIFASPASVRVEFYDYTIFNCEVGFLAVGRERGLSHSVKTTLSLQSRTSRFYVLMDGRWRQFHHHGSIDDPKLLQLYQAAIS